MKNIIALVFVIAFCIAVWTFAVMSITASDVGESSPSNLYSQEVGEPHGKILS